MNISMEQLRYKEVVSLADGTPVRLCGGFRSGHRPGPGPRPSSSRAGPGCWDCWAGSPDRTIPWSAVRRFGEDIVLADLPGQQGD